MTTSEAYSVFTGKPVIDSGVEGSLNDEERRRFKAFVENEKTINEFEEQKYRRKVTQKLLNIVDIGKKISGQLEREQEKREQEYHQRFSEVTYDFKQFDNRRTDHYAEVADQIQGDNEDVYVDWGTNRVDEGAFWVHKSPPWSKTSHKPFYDISDKRLRGRVRVRGRAVGGTYWSYLTMWSEFAARPPEPGLLQIIAPLYFHGYTSYNKNNKYKAHVYQSVVPYVNVRQEIHDTWLGHVELPSLRNYGGLEGRHDETVHVSGVWPVHKSPVRIRVGVGLKARVRRRGNRSELDYASYKFNTTEYLNYVEIPGVHALLYPLD